MITADHSHRLLYNDYMSAGAAASC